MEQDNTTRLFNVKSGHYRDQMSERQKGIWDTHVQLTEQRLKQTQADYEKYRYQRYNQEVEKLWGKLRADIQAPRPQNAPAPHVPTMRELRATAKHRVDERHQTSMNRVREDGQAAINSLIRQVASRERGQDRQRER